MNTTRKGIIYGAAATVALTLGSIGADIMPAHAGLNDPLSDGGAHCESNNGVHIAWNLLIRPKLDASQYASVVVEADGFVVHAIDSAPNATNVHLQRVAPFTGPVVATVTWDGGSGSVTLSQVNGVGCIGQPEVPPTEPEPTCETDESLCPVEPPVDVPPVVVPETPATPIAAPVVPSVPTEVGTPQVTTHTPQLAMTGGSWVLGVIGGGAVALGALLTRGGGKRKVHTLQEGTTR